VRRRTALAAVAAGLAAPALGTVHRVGSGQGLRQALDAAQEGDTVEITAEALHGEVAVVDGKRLRLRGAAATRTVLHADGRHAEGKAILVVRNGDVSIENLEFRGARVPDGNGAGIRFESGRLAVRNCAFFDNEMGMLTANAPDAELMLEGCVFGQAPRLGTVLHHLLYIGALRRASITGCHFSGGWRGHLIKSRARESRILYNHAVDGSEGEASYELDLPNGGLAYVMGNVFAQSRFTQNLALVSFGAEGQAHADSLLVMAHNTLVNEAAQPGWFARVWHERLPKEAASRFVNNLMVGAVAEGGSVGSEELGNVLLPLDALATTPDGRVLPRDRTGLAARTIAAGRVRDVVLTPTAEFHPPAGTQALSPRSAWLPGAHQS